MNFAVAQHRRQPSTATIDGDSVFTLSRRGDLFRLNKTDGSVIWNVQVAELASVRTPGWGFSGSPLVIGNLVLLNVGDAGVAVDRRTGELAWASADKDAGYSSMVPVSIAQREAVVFGSARSYVCVDVATGNEIWRQRWLTTFGCNAADPIVSGKQVFISSGYNRGCALLEIDGESANVVWKNKELQNQLCSSVLIDGFIYGIHGDVDAGTELRCLDLQTGEIRWSETTLCPGAISGAGNRLLVLIDTGELLIVEASPTSFSLLARHAVLVEKCWTAPVLSDGKIFCRSVGGDIACVSVAGATTE